MVASCRRLLEPNAMSMLVRAIGSSPNVASPCSIAKSAAAARVDTDLPVGVLDMAVGGLDRDSEHARDLLVYNPREQRDDLGLALGQPGGRSIRGPLAGRLEHGRDGIRVEEPGATLPPRVSAARSGASGARCGLGSVIAW